MSDEDVEAEIRYLDIISEDCCITPRQQTPTCTDCYLCRVAEFDRIREALRAGRHVVVEIVPREMG